jgi:hypothetical protein
LNALKFSLAGVAEEGKFFRVLRLDSTIRASVFTEKATCALLCIDSKIAIPGKGPFWTGIHTRLRFTGKTKIDFFLFGPIGMDTNS